MTRSLLLTCNSRGATISIHEYDAAQRQVTHLRDVVLPVLAEETHASPMAMSADGAMVYLAWRGSEKRLLALAVDRAGTLELLWDQAIKEDICFLHATGDGARLLGAGGDSVVEFLLDEQGFPTKALPPLPIAAMAHCVLTDGRGRTYVTACRGDLLRSFADDGLLGHFEDMRQPVGSGPRHLSLSPNSKNLYLVTQESGEVVVFSTEGRLREVQRLQMVEGVQAPMGGDIGVTPDGRFVYATERTSNRVVGFAVGDDGMLWRVGAADVPDYPRALCVGGGGKFLAVLGFRGHRTDIFEIGEDGSLTPSGQFATGERPSWMLAVDIE